MKYLKYIFMLPVGLLALSSCSDDLSGTDWKAGEPSEAAGVYFSPDNESYIALIDEDGSGNAVAHLKLNRINSKGDLTVGIKVDNCDEKMVVPSTVTFTDGSDEAYLDIDCSNVTPIVSVPLEVSIEDKYVNPYAAGSGSFAGSVIVSLWENVSETGLTDFSVMSWSYVEENFEHIQSPMLHLAGSNRYMIKDFLGTGADFKFELVKSPYKDNYYRIMPLGNQLLLSDYGYGDSSYYNSWWFLTQDYDPALEDNEDIDLWPDVVLRTPEGQETTIYYIQFFWYDEATKSEYCYVLNYDSGKCTAYMSFFGNTDVDMTKYSPYYRLRFAWKENREE